MDNNNDAILTLYNLPFADYKFILDGGAITSTFHIQISCQSDNPTPGIKLYLTIYSTNL